MKLKTVVQALAQALIAVILIAWGGMWVVGASKMFWNGAPADTIRSGVVIMLCGGVFVVLGIWLARRRSP
jgi:hypothetical protein